MKQILLKRGEIRIEDVPAPAQQANNILVEVRHSLISTGTEISTVQSSKESLIEKAKKRPQAINKIVDSIRVRGIKRTFEMVQSRLDKIQPLGYSCSGRVIGVGKNVTEFQIGDRVACAGATHANHAEIVSVPKNLVTKIPHEVAEKQASFVTVGAIALQGVRRADAKLGETVGVIGLGLIGQITVQLLQSSGCRVIGLDPDANRLEFAQRSGLKAGATSPDEFIQMVKNQSNGQGADAILITAATENSEPIQTAFEAARKKGRVVLVGAVGMNLERSPFYEKELDFLISCSYGPGRYDSTYEEGGVDYPYAFVRWTENRNMSAFLELIGENKVDIAGLIEKEFSHTDASAAYDLLETNRGTKPLAVVLNYPAPPERKTSQLQTVSVPKRNGTPDRIRLGLIGAGEFTQSMHIPNLQKLSERVELIGVCTKNSATVANIGKRLDASIQTTDYMNLLEDPRVDAVLISTRHHLHGEIVVEALKHNKHVFVEKPLALTMDQLSAIESVVRSLSSAPTLMVGFNRRFSPYAQTVNQALTKRTGPLILNYRVNALSLPSNHWVHSEEGGGRLRGEACHMIDFLQAMVGKPIQNAAVMPARGESAALRPDENFSIQLSFEDGSLGTILYTAVGSKELSKEYVELFWDGQSAIVDDFQKIHLIGGTNKTEGGRQDKGHSAILDTFFSSIKNGISFPVPWESLYDTTRTAIELDNEVWGRI